MLRQIAIMSVVCAVFVSDLRAADDWEQGFVQPPASARPWVYWFPLSGNLTKEGITADLEAMQRVGIGGVLYMEVDQGAPKGAADFAGPQWRELFQHACREAARLGLEMNMNNDAGWCGSGGRGSRRTCRCRRSSGPRRSWRVRPSSTVKLPQPQAVQDFYRDIAVLAMPAPRATCAIPNIRGKASFQPQHIPAPAGPVSRRCRPKR